MTNNILFDYKNRGSFKAYINDSYENISDLIKELMPECKNIGLVTDDSALDSSISEIKELINANGNYEIFNMHFSSKGEFTLSEVAEKCIDFLKNSVDANNSLILAIGSAEAITVSNLVSESINSPIHYAYIPTNIDSAINDSIYGDFTDIPLFTYVSVKDICAIDDKEFKNGIADVIRHAIIRDGAFYEWLIMNFNEIMDREESTINELLYKCMLTKQYFVAKDPLHQKECISLNYGEDIQKALLEFFDGNLEPSDALSLGIIASSHIAYKRELLTWEEFYEIRDMFVPFDLPISLDPFDTDTVAGKAYDNISSKDGFVLLKKFGKTIIVNDITLDELKAAITTLSVEWD